MDDDGEEENARLVRRATETAVYLWLFLFVALMLISVVGGIVETVRTFDDEGLFGAFWTGDTNPVFDWQWYRILAVVLVGSLAGRAAFGDMNPALGPRLAEFAGWARLLVLLAALVVAGLLLGLGAPWHIREVIVSGDGAVSETIDGYVLEDSGAWMTVMRSDDRSIQIVDIENITSRTEWEPPREEPDPDEEGD